MNGIELIIKWNMFVIDDIAIAAATEIAAEIATEVATEIATETATEVVSEIPTDLAVETGMAATELVSEVATEIATETATEVVSEFPTDLAAETGMAATELVSEVATEIATETATEVVSEIPTDLAAETDTVATELLSEVATNTTSEIVPELAPEGVADIVSETSNEMGIEGISNVSPERLVNPSDIPNTTRAETTIIGDNIGEINTQNTLRSSLDSIDIKGEETRKLDTNNLSESDCMEQTDCKDSNTHENIDDSSRRIKTINDGLVGQNHPDTGVTYKEKVVVTDTGEKVKGVFAEFKSKIDIQLPEELHQAPDRAQFAECNKQLQEKVATEPKFRSQFTKEQLADIKDGYTPDGYTWHHNEELGKMQLVDSDIHSQTRHTGGRNIWGGGTEHRH